MRTDARPRSLGLALAALLVALAGCEETPVAPETMGSPIPSFNPSPSPSLSPAASGEPAATGSVVPSTRPSPAPSLRPSPTPRPSPTVMRPSIPPPSPSPTPVPSPSPTPTPSPTPSPTASPPNPTPALLRFEQPTNGSNFTANSVPIRLRADVVSGVQVKEFSLFYDGVLLTRQSTANTTFTLNNWNPNQASSTDRTPRRQGPHVLLATVVTTANVATEATFPFEKPYLFRGWTNAAERFSDGSPLSLPPLPNNRTRLHAVAAGSRFFAIHGEGLDGSPATNVMVVNLDAPTRIWVERGFSGLQWRRRPGFTNQGERVFVAGGLVNEVPTARVQAFDLLNQVVYNLPDLPSAVVAPTLVVHQKRLYVIGGSSSGLGAGSRAEVRHLALNPDGSFGTTWSTAKELNLTSNPSQALGRHSAAAVSFGDHIYLMGGEGVAGTLDAVWRYSASSNLWSTVGLLPNAASELRAAVFQDAIWAFGGQSGGSNPVAFRDAVRIDPATLNIQGQTAGQGFGERRSGFGLAPFEDPRNGPRLMAIGGHDLGATGAILPIGTMVQSDAL